MGTSRPSAAASSNASPAIPYIPASPEDIRATLSPEAIAPGPPYTVQPLWSCRGNDFFSGNKVIDQVQVSLIANDNAARDDRVFSRWCDLKDHPVRCLPQQFSRATATVTPLNFLFGRIILSSSCQKRRRFGDRGQVDLFLNKSESWNCLAEFRISSEGMNLNGNRVLGPRRSILARQPLCQRKPAAEPVDGRFHLTESGPDSVNYYL